MDKSRAKVLAVTWSCWMQFVEHFWLESVSPFLINPLEKMVNTEILYGFGFFFFVGGIVSYLTKS